MGTVEAAVDDPRKREAFLRRGLPEALARLREEARPHWGRMTAQQMVEHLLWAMELSTGRLAAECALPEAQRERARRFLYDDRPTPREYMNPLLEAGLPPLRYGTLAEAAAVLTRETDRFLEELKAASGTLRTHPVFGPLTLEEWGRAHFKHGYHHLLQFGLVEEGGGEERRSAS